MYKIGQLSKLTGISTDTLRYYEKYGLITPSTRTSSGYRLYNDASVKEIAFIIRAKRVGFTLSDIEQLLTLNAEKDSHTCQELKSFTEKKLLDIEQKLIELQDIKTSLEALYQTCCGGDERATSCSILNTLETGNGLNSHQ